jgi:hypothetical protein
MRKRVQITLAFSLVAIVGAIIWQVLRERERVYQGKQLSVWLVILYNEMLSGNRDEGIFQPIRLIGTNALPILIERLPAQDARLKQLLMTWAEKQKLCPFHFKSAEQRRIEAILGYQALGPLASAQVPSIIDMLKNDPFLNARQAAARVLGYIGPEARLAAPVLFRATKDTNDSVRINALWALGEIRPDPHHTIPVLVAGLDDADFLARENAALAIGRYGPVAEAAVPALLRTLTTNNAAGTALKAIDPEAAAKAGVK